MDRATISHANGDLELIEDDRRQLLAAPFTAAARDAAIAAFFTPEPVRYPIRKSVVTNRLIEAGLIDVALAALMASPAAFARWVSADWPEIYSDDPEALALLGAIGADVAAIMALPA